MFSQFVKRCKVVTLAAFCLPTIAVAQGDLWERPTLSFMGMPGLFDMPTAHQMTDADLSLTFAGFETTGRATLRFQITDRLAGSFRYLYVDDFLGNGDYFDRSFDISYLIMDEGRYRPAVQVGLQDFGGTGIYAAEYIVATKTFGALRATGGIGWGRFGSQNGFSNPLGVVSDNFDQRPEAISGIDTTGQLDTSNWFRGDAAFFGGLEYAVNDRLRLALEYSSDAYEAEEDRIDFQVKSPVNVGLSYAFRNGTNIKAGWLYGTTAGVQLSYVLNAKEPRHPPLVRAGAPQPVAVRGRRSAQDLGWTQDSGLPDRASAAFGQAIAADGLTLDQMVLRANSVEVRYRNGGAMPQAQALGRMSRVLTNLMPASVEEFVFIAASENGLPGSRIVIQRSDVEELEFAPDGAWQIFARSRINDAGDSGLGFDLARGSTQKLTWGVGPYVQSSYFDPDSPVRFEGGVQASGRYEPTPGLVFSGLARHRVFGNRDDLPESNSVIQRVRSDNALYAQEGETALVNLTAAKYFRPGKDLYGRVTAGYLESMYGGLSGEVLWKPVDSRLALGAEVNFVKQRAFAQDFDFQDYEVVTGHVSAYYKANNDFHYQLDVGRYLAGDWGGTLTVDREFDNGIRIGAFATITDVPFEDFGEGSFDKGIRIDIPISAITGQRSNTRIARTIRPVLRDGGARVNVEGRLYESVRDLHQPDLQDQWGRFWR